MYANLEGLNDEDAFGLQPVVNEIGEVEGFNDRLLIGATGISLEDLVDHVHGYHGLAVAAHIDRPSFSVISQLGFVPDHVAFDALEISARLGIRGGRERFPELRVIPSSHHLMPIISRTSGSHHAHVSRKPEHRRDTHGVETGTGKVRLGGCMIELALHILDIAENSTRAHASFIEITIVEDLTADVFSFEIRDNGSGMDQETLRKAMDPFYTTKKVRKIGLGLPMLAQAAERAGGRFEIESAPGVGTRVYARFRHSHIDRQPLGDIPGVITALILGTRISISSIPTREEERPISSTPGKCAQSSGTFPSTTWR